jgi:hypothetical protein
MWPAGVSPPLARDLCRPSAVRGRAWPACGSTSTLTQTRPLAVALRCAVHAVCCLLCRSSHACRSLLKADRCTAALRHVYRSCAQSNPTQPAVSATAHRGLRTVGYCGALWGTVGNSVLQYYRHGTTEKPRRNLTRAGRRGLPRLGASARRDQGGRSCAHEHAARSAAHRSSRFLMNGSCLSSKSIACRRRASSVV